MDDFLIRLALLLNIVVPLVFFMAAVYLALHMLFARFIQSADSPVLWFFGVVTGPLTRPVRSFLPPGTSEPRIRAVSLAVYVVAWIAVRALFVGLGARPG